MARGGATIHTASQRRRLGRRKGGQAAAPARPEKSDATQKKRVPIWTDRDQQRRGPPRAPGAAEANAAKGAVALTRLGEEESGTEVSKVSAD